MTPDDLDLIRRRQKSRAIVVALLLAAFVILVFFITISKIRQGERPDGAPSANTALIRNVQ